MTNLQLNRQLTKYENSKEGVKSEYYVYYVVIDDIQVRLKPIDTTSKLLLEKAFENLDGIKDRTN